MLRNSFPWLIMGLLLTPQLAYSQTQLRVATWNIENVGSPGSAQYLAAEQVLERIDADVVGINEVNSSADVSNITQLAADTGYPHIFIADPMFGSARNAVLSKYPFAGQEGYNSAELSGQSSAADMTREIASATIDLPAGTRDLVVFVQHFKASSTNADEFRRAVEAQRMVQAASSLDRGLDAYVFMGDFNEESDSVPRSPNTFTSVPSGLPGSYVLGSDMQTILSGAGLLNDPFFPLTNPAGPAATILEARQLDGTDVTRPASGRRLDYLLVSSSLAAGSPASEVYDSADEGLSGGLSKQGNPLSSGTALAAADHLLVFADLTVPADGTGCTSDAQCSDGLFCNGAEVCSAGACQPGTPPCAANLCNESGDTCQTISAPVWINEIHYDNAGADVNEGVEIAGPAGTDLTGYRVIAYNGNGGGSYQSAQLSGTIPNQQAGYGTLHFAMSGLQNGAPDALALVDSSDVVLEFLSYEGVLVGTSGPANGLTSTNIGVTESGTTPVDTSLQRVGTGTGVADFSWAPSSAASRGQINTGQSFQVQAACTADSDCASGETCNLSSGVCEGFDLTISSVSAPSSVSANYSVTVEVCNLGNIAAPDTLVEVYLSADDTLVTNHQNPATTDTAVAWLTSGVLNAGACISLSGSVDIADTPAGTSRVFAIVDEYETVLETNESNNVFMAGTLQNGSGSGGPDLVVTVVTAPANNTTDYQVDYTICNQGGAVTLDTWAEVYLSADSSLTTVAQDPNTPDIAIAWPLVSALAPGACFSGNSLIPLNDAPAGSYHLFAVVDPYGLQTDVNTANNTLAGPQITLGAPSGGGSGIDLTVSSVVAPATASGAFNLDITLCNQGDTDSAAPLLEVYLSTDTSLETNFSHPGSADMAIAWPATSGLLAGACNTITWTVDASDVPSSGTFHLFAIVDGFATIQESNETNNSFSPGTITFQ